MHSDAHLAHGKLYRWCNHRWTFPLTLILAALLMLPALLGSITIDDLVQESLITNKTIWSNDSHWALSYFTFFDGQLERNEEIILKFGAPWWTDPQLKINFFRPLAAVSHWLDYILSNNNFTWMYLHNVLLYLLLITVINRFARLIYPEHKATANLLTLFFAVAFSHYLPVSWIANRNSLLATLFAVLCLISFHHYLAHGWRAGMWATPLLLLCSLLSGETGTGTCAFLFAYVVFLTNRNWKQVTLALLPSALVAIIWYLVYKHLGYGTAHSGLYLDPGESPLYFLSQALVRYPVLLFLQFSGLTILVFPDSPYGLDSGFITISIIYLVFCAVVFTPVLKQSRSARFWLVSCVIASLPACTTTPQERVAILSGIGAMGLISETIMFYSNRLHQTLNGFYRRLLPLASILFISLLLIFQPIAVAGAMVVGANKPKLLEQVETMQWVDASAGKINVFINSPHVRSLPSWIIAAHYLGKPLPIENHNLAPHYYPIKLARVDKYSLRMQLDQWYLPGFAHRVQVLFRPAIPTFKVGDSFQHGDLTAIIEATNSHGEPTQILFRFQHELEDPRYRFWIWQDEEPRALALKDLPDHIE